MLHYNNVALSNVSLLHVFIILMLPYFDIALIHFANSLIHILMLHYFNAALDQSCTFLYCNVTTRFGHILVHFMSFFLA